MGKSERDRRRTSDERLHGAVFGFTEGNTTYDGIVDIVRGNGHGNLRVIAERAVAGVKRVEQKQNEIGAEVTGARTEAKAAAKEARSAATAAKSAATEASTAATDAKAAATAAGAAATKASKAADLARVGIETLTAHIDPDQQLKEPEPVA